MLDFPGAVRLRLREAWYPHEDKMTSKVLSRGLLAKIASYSLARFVVRLHNRSDAAARGPHSPFHEYV